MSETKNLKLFKHNEPLETNENQFDIDLALNQNWDKLDNFAEKVNDKVIEIEDKHEQYDTDISNIKQEQQEQNSKIENNTTQNEEQTELLNQIVNILPTATGEGEYVTLQDTAEMKFKKFEVQGNSKQDTRSGKNLLNNRLDEILQFGIIYKTQNNGEVVANGTAAGSNSTAKVGELTVKANVNYRLTGCPRNGSNNTYMVGIQREGNSGYDYFDVGTGVNFKFSQDTKIFILIRVMQNTSVSNLTFFPMVREADNGNDDYEPYGASPSPDFPSKIRNSGDNINLYSKDNANILNTMIDTQGLGVNAGDTYKTIYIPCKPNTTYTVSKIYDATKNRFALAYTNTEPTYNMQVEGYTPNANTSNITITTGTNAKYLLAYIWITGGTTTYKEMLNSIKIEEGTQATAYSPYNCGSAEIIVCNKNFANLEIVNTQFKVNTEKINNNTFKVTRTTTDGTAYGQIEMYLQKNKQYTIFMQAEGKDIENARISIMKDYNGKGYIKADITNYFTFTTEQEKLVILMYPTNKGNLQGLETIFKIMIVEGNNTQQEFKDNEQQTILFPFTEGQRLYKGDYLAENGIHRRIREFIIIGTEKIFDVKLIEKGKVLFNLYCVGLPGEAWGDSPIRFCNIFNKSQFKKWGSLTETATDGIATFTDQVKILCNNVFGIVTEDDLETRRGKVSNWIKQNNIVLDIELENEEIEPYTQEQQEAYNQLKKLHSYNEQTNIFSTDEISSVFNVEAIKNLNATFAQLSATMLERS